MTVRTDRGQGMLISGLSSFPRVDGGVPGAARFPPCGFVPWPRGLWTVPTCRAKPWVTWRQSPAPASAAGLQSRAHAVWDVTASSGPGDCCFSGSDGLWLSTHWLQEFVKENKVFVSGWKTQLAGFFHQKVSKLARHLVAFRDIENFPYFTFFVGWDDFFQN